MSRFSFSYYVLDPDWILFITLVCKALEVINFLNDLYSTMDERMDKHDVYKVETISDSYLVASGLPNRNGDK